MSGFLLLEDPLERDSTVVFLLVISIQISMNAQLVWIIVFLIKPAKIEEEDINVFVKTVLGLTP